MLLRLFRFRESVTQEPESLYEAEFCSKTGEPDLELSVYSVKLEQHVQTCLEHHASAGADPPRRAIGAYVEAIRDDGVEDPTTAPFAFIRLAHRTLTFADGAALLAFVTALVEQIRANAAATISEDKNTLRAWLRARVVARDPEWETFLASATDDWKKFAR